jgi:transcription initiation factor TFIIIB Brf1 subunit/transcription initiation factor TFIIB
LISKPAGAPIKSKFNELKDRFIELYDSGATHESISRELGIAVPTVSVWRERLGLPLRRALRSRRAWWDEACLGKKTVKQMLMELAPRLRLSRGDIRSILGLFTRRMVQGWKVRGRPLQDLMLTTVFLYIRAWRPPVSASQFCDSCFEAGYRVTQKQMLRISKELRKAGVKVSTPKPWQVLERHKYALKKELGADEELIKKARELTLRAHKQRLIHGRSPFSVAGSAIYLATKDRSDIYITEDDVSRFFGVSEVTIRNVNKILAPVLFDRTRDSNLVKGDMDA